MSSVPEGWKEVKIKYICRVDSGQGAPQGEKYFNGDKIFVRAGDLNKLYNGIYVGDFCSHISDEAVKKFKLKIYKKDSIVFPKSGMSVKTGNIAKLRYDCYVVNHLAIIECGKEIDSTFLFYVLKKMNIANICKNESYPSIRIYDVNNFKIPLPPLETQKKIVSILGKAEALKQKRDDADKFTQDYLKSVFSEMFGDFELKSFDSDIIEIIDGDRGVNYPKGNEFYDKEFCLFLNTRNVTKNGFNFDKLMFITKEKDSKLRKGKAQYNDVILTTRGTVGNVSLYDNSVPYENVRINSGMVLLRPNREEINPKFLTYLFRMPIIRNQFLSTISGTAQPQLPINSLKKVKIIIPPIDIQNKFLIIVQQVEAMKEHQKKSKQEIDDLFNSLMQKAFKGALVK